MLELLVVGSWLFWVIFFTFSVIAIAGLETDTYGWMGLATVVVVSLFGWHIPFAAISIKLVIQCAAAYIGIGAAWSIIKWWRHVRNLVNIFKSGKDRSLTATDTRFYASYNKSKITAWIAYWPWSVFWSLTHDIFTNVYNLLASFYNRISDKALAEVKALQAAKDAEKANQEKR